MSTIRGQAIRRVVPLPALLLLAAGCVPMGLQPMADDGAPAAGSDDPIEHLRLLQRGAKGGDVRSALTWLGRVSEARATVSQRMLARTALEDRLAGAGFRDEAGREASAQVREQLALSWRFHEPASAERARRIAAGEPSVWRPPQEPAAGDGYWAEERGTVWAGGHDRLFLATGVLAFLVDAVGEPVFRGTHVWMANLGMRTVYVSCGPASEYDRPLRPGERVLLALDLRRVGTGTFTTGVDVGIRAWRTRDILVRSSGREP